MAKRARASINAPSEHPSQQRLSHAYVMIQPAEESALPVAISEWKNIRSMVNAISSRVPVFHSIAYFMFGTSVSAILQGLSLWDNAGPANTKAHSIVWCVGFASLAIGLLSLYFASAEKKIVTDSKQRILDELDRIGQKFGQGNSGGIGGIRRRVIQ